MLEVAMWWGGGSEAGFYGAFAADRVFLPREDLGGAAALVAGGRKIHAMGRRVQLYVSADIVHLLRKKDASQVEDAAAAVPVPAGPAPRIKRKQTLTRTRRLRRRARSLHANT